jgi:hypothetical protein
VTALALPLGQLAATVDTGERTAEGILVPWGEDGRTNLGRGRPVRRGALRPSSRVVGIHGHDRERPVSRLIAHEDRPEGLWGKLKIADTPAGDQLIAEIRAGVRDALSVEASDLEFDTSGGITAGVVDFVAHVPVGAYPSAGVHTLAAAVSDPLTGDSPLTAPVAPAAPAADAAPAAPAIDYNQLAAAMAPLLAPQLSAAVAPAGLPTSSLPDPGLAPSAAPKADEEDVIAQTATLMAGVYRGDTTLMAALQDITNSNLPIFQAPSGTLGEKLWEGAGYQRQFVQLFRQRPLTSWEFRGWQWINRPRMQNYTGDKNDVPSNAVSVTQVTGKASRLAGAWDIDRKFVDFGDAEFWSELMIATTESYLEESDLRAAAALVDYAIDVTADPADFPTYTVNGQEVPAYALPDGYDSIITGPVADILRAVALGTAVLEDTPRVRKGPDYVVVNTGDWLKLADITNIDLPAFLALLKVNPDQFRRSSLVAPGTVVLGVTQANTFRELSSTPIRVNAQNIPKGGVDEAVFGYTGISMDRPGGTISVPIAAAP